MNEELEIKKRELKEIKEREKERKELSKVNQEIFDSKPLGKFLKFVKKKI